MLPLLLLAFGLAAPAHPQSLPEVRAERIEAGARPAIDGVLDEPAWAQAEVASGFVQLRPHPGQPASQRTEALVLYDDEAVYVAFRNYDTDPAGILRPMARRDEHTVSDRVLVAFDSYGDGRTAFVFGVNAAGVKQDFLIYNDTQEDNSWDAVWDVAVSDLPEGGWTAEFRIPLSQLRFSATRGEQPWGVQFYRAIPRAGEESFWAPMLPGVSGMVSRFGRLVGVEGLRPPRRLEVQPYAASSLTRAPGDSADPFFRPNALAANVGADLRYGLASNLTLSATVNPDFGQVEADPATVNLTAFETFFPERRPFFVEGADVFGYGRTLGYTAAFRPTFFYSRRIGRPPRRALSGDGFAWVDTPEQTTIAAAAKVSGKVGPWSVGVLDAVTTPERARFVGPDGVHGSAPVEPLANYLVARAKRDFREGGSAVGLIATAANRRLTDPAFAPLLAEGAYLGGLDFEHRWADRAWSVSGVVGGSLVHGDAAFIERLQRAPQRYYNRPDASHLSLDPARTALSGGYAELALAQTGGRLRYSTTFTAVTAGFDVNDLGFQGRADGYALTGIVLYEEPEPRWAAVRQWGGNVNWAYGANGAGDLIVRQLNANLYYNLASFWGGGFWTGVTPLPVKDDRLTRGGPLAERPPDVAFNTWLFSDNRKRVYWNASAFVRRDLREGAMAGEEMNLSVTTRPTPALLLSVGPTYARTASDRQYVRRVDDAAAPFGRRDVFARLRQQTLALGVRANWTFQENLTLQLYAQPYLAAGQYAGFREFAEPGTSRFTVYGQDRGTITPTASGYAVDPGDGGAPFTISDPDFTFRSLRANAVLRWEYRPGSTLFVVWQQNRSGFDAVGAFDPWRDAGALLRAPSHDVFLVKLSYRLAN